MLQQQTDAAYDETIRQKIDCIQSVASIWCRLPAMWVGTKIENGRQRSEPRGEPKTIAPGVSSRANHIISARFSTGQIFATNDQT